MTVARIARDGNSSCRVFERTVEILVGRPGPSPPRPLAPAPGGGCVPRVADIDGDHLALLRGDRPGRELAVLDVRTGATLAEMAFDQRREFRGSQLAIGGRHLALTSISGEPRPGGNAFELDFAPQVSFFDWTERRALAAVSTARDGRETNNGDDRLATDDDGVAVLSTADVRSPLDGPLMDRVSPADPSSRPMPVTGYDGPAA